MINEILLLILCIVLSGVFSSTEIAMFSISEIRLRHLVEHKKRNAVLLKQMREDSHKLLITILIGNNIANIAGAALATAIAIDMFGDAGVGIATGVMTLIILVAGEISPKAFATRNAQKIALRMTPIINFLMKLFYPLVILFDKITTMIVPKGKSMGTKVTEEEVRDILRMSEEQGSIKEQEEEMIQNIFKLDDTYASDIMTPRPDVFAYDERTVSSDVLLEIKEKGYSRIPLYKDDLDSISGVLHVKDLIDVNEPILLGTLTRPVFRIPETMRIDKLLLEFKQRKMHLAIVINEHGTVVGVITIEDILEEIVGEIYDETDGEEEQEEDIRIIKEGVYLIKGKAEIEDINEALDLDIDDDNHSTVSGFVMKHLNRIPDIEDSFNYAGYKFTVKKIEQNSRVSLVFVHKL